MSQSHEMLPLSQILTAMESHSSSSSACHDAQLNVAVHGAGGVCVGRWCPPNGQEEASCQVPLQVAEQAQHQRRATNVNTRGDVCQQQSGVAAVAILGSWDGGAANAALRAQGPVAAPCNRHANNIRFWGRYYPPVEASVNASPELGTERSASGRPSCASPPLSLTCATAGPEQRAAELSSSL